MKTVNYGMNVLNDNGMSASVYNPKHLKSIMQLVRVTLKNGQAFLSLYQPTTIAKIENEKHVSIWIKTSKIYSIIKNIFHFVILSLNQKF
jgi:hypothetical protein